MPKPDNDKLQFKSFGLKLTKAPDDEGYFEGYAAVFGNEDSDGDVIEPGAFAKTLKENAEVPILWQHKPDEPIGISVSMEEDDKGLKVSGQLELGTQRGQEALALMKLGALKGLSIGYQTVKDTVERRSSGTGMLRRLKELKLWEWSPVTFPSNELAGVSLVKALGATARSAKSYYDVYWDDDYNQIGCLLTMISCGTEFAISEGDEDDPDEAADVAAMQAILASLADLLASELAELGTDDEDDEEDDVVVVEAMSARLGTILCKEGKVLSAANRKLVEHAVEALTALLDSAEPAKATQRGERAATKSEEPELASTLRSLTDALRSKSATPAQGA